MTPGTEPALSADEWLSGINRGKKKNCSYLQNKIFEKTKVEIKLIHVCMYTSRSGAYVLKRGLQQTQQAGVQGPSEGEEGWSGQWD